MKSYFVAGTDTGVGKSLVSAAILHAANQQGYSTLGLKPIAAGCELTDDGWQNEDAQLLRQYASKKLAYEAVNPIALKQAIAPHIAAANEGKRLRLERTVGFVRGAMTHKVDLCLVEGAGGWRVPLNESETLAGLPKALNLPVVLVVGMRLGCLNHALLSAEAIVGDGVNIVGWVANVIDGAMPERANNIATLKSWWPFPLLGEIPQLPTASIEQAAGFLNISRLLGEETLS